MPTRAVPGPRHARRLPTVAALVLLAACNGRTDGPADRDPGDQAGDPPSGDRAPTVVESSPDGDRPVCLHDQPFVADGAVPLDPAASGDATELADIRWERHEGCERLVLDLVGEDGGSATSAGAVQARVRRELGVVRIGLRGVEGVDPDATDASFDGPLARSAYAVRSPDGLWIYVDLHLGDAAEAGILVLSDPARVVVDLRPGGGPIPAWAAVSRRVVVLEPRPGRASYPLVVTGYARTFEANVVARIERSHQIALEDYTTATAWADAWGHYSFTIPDGPSGPVRLHVGEHSARDGTWEGVAVDLEMRCGGGGSGLGARGSGLGLGLGLGLALGLGRLVSHTPNWRR